MANARAQRKDAKNASSKDSGRPKAGGPVPATIKLPEAKPAIKPSRAADFGQKMASKKPPRPKNKSTKAPAPKKAPNVAGGPGKAGPAVQGGAPTKGDDTKAVAKDLTSSKPTPFGKKLPTTGKKLSTAGKAEAAKATKALPKFKATMPGEASAKTGKPIKAKADDKVKAEGKGPEAKAPKLPKEKAGKSTQKKVGGAAMAGLGKDTAAEQVQANFSAAVKGVSNKSGVNTDPGPAPDVKLSGKSAPIRAEKGDADADQKMDKALQEQWKAIDKGPGPQNVQRVELQEEFVPQEFDPGDIPELNPDQKMSDYLDAPVPANVRDKADDIMAPAFSANLGKAEKQFDDAVSKRDEARDKAVADAESKVSKANADAQQTQEKQVKQARKDIVQGQKETKKKQAKELAKAKRKGDKEKKKVEKSIAKKTADTDKKVAKKYAEGKKKAEAKKVAAENKAAAKKREAEKKKENMSWWERATSAIGDFLDSLVDVIGGIFDALANAVSSVLNAVKDYAMKAIDAAVSFATKALDVFAGFLKGLVTELLGSVFPGLAKSLCELIDKVAEASKKAIKKFGDGLKKAVSAVIDGLNKVVQKVLEIAKVALTTALTVAAAVVTGDWERAFKALLDGALQIAGIPPAEFYKLMGKGMDTLKAIVQNPGAFVGNLIKAAVQGFKQFSGNFLKHLVGGIVGFLTMQMRSSGLRLPKKWDAAGIFDLVMQIAGLSKDKIFEQVERKLGKKNRDRIEWVWEKVEVFLKDGVSGLWDQVASYVGNLWDMALDGIKGFIGTKIVKAAAIKIASMFNPAGAIVQALITAWNVYQFIKTQAARLMKLVTGFINAMAAIVAGQIGDGANKVERGLADSIPLAIDMLARLLGISGIGKKVKEIIGGFQKKVTKALDKVIDAVWSKGKGAFEKMKSLGKGKDADAKKDDKKDAKKEGDKKDDKAAKPDLSQLPAPILATKGGVVEITWKDGPGGPQMMAAKTYPGAVRAKSLPDIDKAFLPLAKTPKKDEVAKDLKHGKGMAMVSESKAKKWQESGGKDLAGVNSSVNLFANNLFEVVDYIAEAKDAEFPAPTQFTAEGENHKVWVEDKNGEPEVMVASTPRTLRSRIADWRKWTPSLDPADQSKFAAGLNTLEALDKQVEALEDKVQSGDKAAELKLRGVQKDLSKALWETFKLVPDDKIKLAVEVFFDRAPFKAFLAQVKTMNTDYALGIDPVKEAKDAWRFVLSNLRTIEDDYVSLPGANGSPADRYKDLGTQAFQNLMDTFNPMIKVFNGWLDSQMATAGSADWTFWSGTPAKDVAKAAGGMVLELSAIGKQFDAKGVSLQSGAQMALWGALSRAYARRAAEDVESRTYKGFLGRDAGRDQSIFNKIESPAFTDVSGKKLSVDVDVVWYATAAKWNGAKITGPDFGQNMGGIAGTLGQSKNDRSAMIKLFNDTYAAELGPSA